MKGSGEIIQKAGLILDGIEGCELNLFMEREG